ncbi:MAG TPA: hypothetical protein VKJ65_06785 [Phycisphaerae bacterium]|nr:hypothetical protein [Phycisphaerae bacterium]
MKTIPPNPPTASQVLDAYFLEVRARLIEIAATLDRVDRAPGRQALQGDSRLDFIARSLAVLQAAGPDRARQIQELYSIS